jgi:flagellum-specific peptidoglycan hydrolase FlgJ
MRLETGHFTSDLCLQANNLVGMKHPKTRQTTASYTTSSGYGGYASYIEHIYDIKLWQDYYCVDTIKDDLSYIDFLCRFHATDKQYKQKLLKLMR